jgi:hypothetical protein
MTPALVYQIKMSPSSAQKRSFKFRIVLRLEMGTPIARRGSTAQKLVYAYQLQTVATTMMPSAALWRNLAHRFRVVLTLAVICTLILRAVVAVLTMNTAISPGCAQVYQNAARMPIRSAVLIVQAGALVLNAARVSFTEARWREIPLLAARVFLDIRVSLEMVIQCALKLSPLLRSLKLWLSPINLEDSKNTKMEATPPWKTLPWPLWTSMVI